MAAMTFFDDLSPLRSISNIFSKNGYCPAPLDWLAVATDVLGSTAAVEQGQQKAVNFVGASAIAALKNMCAPTNIPFQFVGDGTMALVPPERATDARRELARTRGFAQREYGLALRVGAVPVAELQRLGGKVLVGRYEPSPGNIFGVFEGGGFEQLENAIKGRGLEKRLIELAALAQISESLDDGEPPDLTGLSCRWSPLPSQRGTMVALVIQGDLDHGQLYNDLTRLADCDIAGLRAVSLDNLIARWPPDTTLEAKARATRMHRLLVKPSILAESLLMKLLLTLNLTLGRFDPKKYLSEMVSNTDFVKHDDTLAVVFDCPVHRINGLQTYLDERKGKNELQYGMQLSDMALMTCLVEEASDNRHIHFVDGGHGGYTMAAKKLKAALAQQQ